MPVIFFDRVNPAPLLDDDFSYTYSAWVANTVDTLNETISEAQTQINGEGLTTFVTRKTSAEITALIDMNAKPVLPSGLWLDTTIGKLKFLVTPAVAGVSNGITETVTSV